METLAADLIDVMRALVHDEIVRSQIDTASPGLSIAAAARSHEAEQRQHYHDRKVTPA